MKDKKPRYLDAYADEVGTPKKWEIINLVTDEEVSKFLNQGYEPYGLVFVPGVGVVHFLRIFR